MDVDRRLGTPLFAGIATLVVTASTLGAFNHDVAGDGGLVRPEVHRAEAWIAMGLGLTIPIVCGWLVAIWARIPAPRRLKRRHVFRTTAIQAIAVALAVGGLFATRPTTFRASASARAEDGRVGYVFSNGPYVDIAVSDGSFGARYVTFIGPFPNDRPPPKLVWRGKVMVLLDADGKEVARWFDD